jgi:2-polyprenyl-6-methoxyphenol hydroxylase-like FAD-dependent oxidoreductase
MKNFSVIVVGAGPVGLLATLRLAQAGINTTCVEALDKVDASPRAMAYHPVAVKELDRAGVLEDCRRIGSRGNGICWRNTKTGEVIAQLDRAPSKDFPYENLTIGQHLLAGIILEHLKNYDNAKVLFSTKVTAIDQSGDEVILTVEDSAGSSRNLHSTYCIAADGGRSTMRRLLDISFDGFTYDEQLVSTNVYYDFAAHGWKDGNFMVDPDHWALIGRIDNSGLWRVSYGEKPGLTHDEIKERMPWKFSEMFPGQKPPNYQLNQMSPYRLNQRCADTFRKGRTILAGDAAHLCNPFGGLGLTGGILDAGAAADALIGIFEDKADDSILEKYAEIRRTIFVETVNPTSQSNKMRLHDSNPDTIGDRDPFLNMLRTATPEDLQRVRANMTLAVDMTQYYNNAEITGRTNQQGPDREGQQGIGVQANGPQTTTVR